MPDTANFYPLDYDVVKKGDVFTEDDIARLEGTSKNDPKFWSIKLNFGARLARELRARQKFWTVYQHQKCIVVAGDADASVYNHKRAGKSVHNLKRAHMLASHVDLAALTAEQRAKHEKQVLLTGRLVQALRTTTAVYRLEVTARKTPGLLPKPNGDAAPKAAQ